MTFFFIGTKDYQKKKKKNMHYLCLIALEVLNVTVHLSREKPIFKFKSSIFFNNCCKTFRDFLYPKKDLFSVSPSKFTGQYCGLCDIN